MLSFKSWPELAGDSGAGRDALAVLLNRGFLETVEIAQQVDPLNVEAVAPAQVGGVFQAASIRSAA